MSDGFDDIFNELIEMGGAIRIRFVNCPRCGASYIWLALTDRDDDDGIDAFTHAAQNAVLMPSYVIIMDEDTHNTARVRKVWPRPSNGINEQTLTAEQWRAVEAALLDRHVCSEVDE